MSTLVDSLTTQEAYERIRTYFTRPDAVLARNPMSGTCYYRDSEGNKCAVGCLIPDELYDKQLSENVTLGSKIEGKNMNAAIEAHEELRDLLNGLSPEGRKKRAFLAEAQGHHDSTSTNSVEEFIVKLDATAIAYGLTVPIG